MKFEILVNDVDNSISDYQTAITFAGTQLLEKATSLQNTLTPAWNVKKAIRQG